MILCQRVVSSWNIFWISYDFGADNNLRSFIAEPRSYTWCQLNGLRCTQRGHTRIRDSFLRTVLCNVL